MALVPGLPLHCRLCVLARKYLLAVCPPRNRAVSDLTLFVFFFQSQWAAKGRHFTRAAEEAHEALLVGGLGAPAVATALSLEAGNSKEKELEAEIKHIDY